MSWIDFELQDAQAIHIMRNHFHLWKWIHVIPNLTADRFANMLHVIKAFDNAIVIYTEEEKATQAIGKSTFANGGNTIRDSNAGKPSTISVFASLFLSAIYILNGRKVVTWIL